MSAPRRNIKGQTIFSRQLMSDPFAVSRRFRTNIYGNVENLPGYRPYQFALGPRWKLVMKSSNSPRFRPGVIFLDKTLAQTCRGKFRFLVRFHEEAAAVGENAGFDNHHAIQFG